MSERSEETKAWEQWFTKQVDGGDEWTSTERLLAKDAWMSALRWSGYFEMQNSMKMLNSVLDRRDGKPAQKVETGDLFEGLPGDHD